MCGLTSWRDPLKIKISGGPFSVLTSPVSVEIYWQFWGLLEYLPLFFSPSHYHPALWLLCLPLPLGVLVLVLAALFSLAISVSLFPSLCLFSACWYLSDYLIGFRKGKLRVPGVLQG